MRLNNNTRTGYILLDTKNEIECPKCKAKPGEDCIIPKYRKADIHTERQELFLKKIDEENEQEVISKYVKEPGSVGALFDEIFSSVPLGSGGFKDN